MSQQILIPTKSLLLFLDLKKLRIFHIPIKHQNIYSDAGFDLKFNGVGVL